MLQRLTSVEPPAPDPRFWSEVAAAQQKRPGRGRLWLGALGLAAALGALVLVPRLMPPGPGGEVRTKGAVALGVVARRASGQVDRLAAGDRVAAGDVLRFEITHGNGGFAAVLGLDARPSVTVYAPQSGPAVQLAGGGKILLPEAIVADATPGAERIVAVVCPSALTADELTRAAEGALRAAGGRPEAVGELPLPCAQSPVVVRKAEAP
jgi:hypothetical protein